MDKPVLAAQTNNKKTKKKPSSVSSDWRLDNVYKDFQKQWPIGTESKRKSQRNPCVEDYDDCLTKLYKSTYFPEY